MVAGLLDRRFDLTIISLPFEQPNLEIIHLFDEELIILRPSPTANRSGKVREITPGELAAAKFLLYPTRSNMRTIIESFFRDLALRHKWERKPTIPR